jgi:peptidyl-prolyl cis-trans isomerase SurA
MTRTFRPLTFLLASVFVAAPAFAGQAPLFMAPQAQPQAPSPAQSGMAIAAVVNEDIITVFDVQSRIGLVMTTSGLENTPDLQQRLLPQVVDILIEERLKLQEAKRQKVVTTEDEVRQSLESIESRNGMQPGAFRAMLGERGIDMSALYSQLEADISWGKVVRQTLQSEVSVSREEVEAVIARARANQGKAEYLVAEISLPVTSPAQDQIVRDMANKLVLQARGGTPFPALAQQFSQSATAGLGGDLGWVVPGDMEPELDAVVARMEPEQISDPVRTATGYHIIMLREKRTAGAPDPRMTIVTLNQIYLPNLGKKAIPPDRMAQLSQTISGFTSCEQMDKFGQELGTPGSGPITPVYIGGLPDKVRDVVTNLQPGRTSPAIEVGGARLFLQVCMRRDDTGVPSGDAIRNDLENEKLQNVARQKLRDLRRQALIDIRL